MSSEINLVALAIRQELTTNDLKEMMWAYPISGSDLKKMLSPGIVGLARCSLTRCSPEFRPHMLAWFPIRCLSTQLI